MWRTQRDNFVGHREQLQLELLVARLLASPAILKNVILGVGFFLSHFHQWCAFSLRVMDTEWAVVRGRGAAKWKCGDIGKCAWCCECRVVKSVGLITCGVWVQQFRVFWLCTSRLGPNSSTLGARTGLPSSFSRFSSCVTSSGTSSSFSTIFRRVQHLPARP